MRSSFATLISRLLAAVALIGAAASVHAQTRPALYPIQKSPLVLPKNTAFPIILPYQAWQGMPLVLITLNGANIPERCILDTGLNACAVTPEIYTRLALQALGRQVRVNVLDMTREADEAEIKTLQIGTVTLEKVPAVLLSVFGMLSRSPRPDAPACWLGTPFLSAFQVTFDFEKRQALLNPAQNPLPTDPGTVIVPMTLNEGRIWVKVTPQGGKPFQALLDTGTVGTLIPVETAAKLKLKPTQIVTVARPTGEEAKAGLVVVPKLSVGKAEVKDVRAVHLAADAPAKFDQTLGVLGMDFLSHFKLTIDYAKKRVAFTPLSSPDAQPTEAVGQVPPPLVR